MIIERRYRFLFPIIPLFFCVSCGESIKEKISSKSCNKEIESITIYNKTANRYIADKIEVTEPNKINLICSELNNLKEVSNVGVTANFGFYELETHLINKGKYSISIIYTKYDGVIIEDENNKFYKNDKLEYVVLDLFQ